MIYKYGDNGGAKMKTLFKNATILQFDLDKNFLKGDVVVDGDTILQVSSNPIVEHGFDRIIDCKNSILMPGFINAHTHSAMTLFRGIKDDVCLQEWLFDNMIPLENQFENEDVYWGTMLAIAEQVRGGITSMQDMYYRNEETARAAKTAKFRANIGVSLDKTQHGNKEFKTDTEVDELFATIVSSDGLVMPSVMSHAIYTQSQAFLERAVCTSARKHCPISIHLSETLTEVGECLTENNLTPPQYLESLGYLDRACTVYHGVHMDKDDIALLAQYSTNVVSCPSSNLKLGSGIAPLFAMQNAGINIALGTDGAASNNSLDMFKEMFLAATLQKAVLNDASILTAKQVLQMATKNGARAIGMPNIGEIKAGYKADIILVSTTEPHWHPHNNLLSHLVYSARSSDVVLTMINGTIVYDHGAYHIGESIETIYEQCKNIIARLKQQARIGEHHG